MFVDVMGSRFAGDVLVVQFSQSYRSWGVQYLFDSGSADWLILRPVVLDA